jgi:hypothetical protein
MTAGESRRYSGSSEVKKQRTALAWLMATRTGELLTLALFTLCCFMPVNAKAQSRQVHSDRAAEWSQAFRMADFILSLQNAAGAIPDQPGATTVNEDSNMEYALIALGAAYAATKDSRYRDGLERGIRWLAEREEMTDPLWTGSWRYVYSATPPYAAIPTSPGAGITDVRGVDATSTLFVYLLYLDQKLTGSDTLVRSYAANAQAALDFVITHNLDKDGFSWSSWQHHASDGQWHLYAFKYSADQGDVYLGMQAGSLLYHSSEYERVARFLKENTPLRFFSKTAGRYGLGLNQKGLLDPKPYVFAQGYLPWMWGNTLQNRQALAWLRSRVRSDGSPIEPDGKPASSLSAAMLGMAAAALKQPEPLKSFQWLRTKPYDPASGGVHETADPKSSEYVNVAGFCAISLLGFMPSN